MDYWNKKLGYEFNYEHISDNSAINQWHPGGEGSYDADMPFRFLPCLVAGLAYYIAMKTPELSERVVMLKQIYDEQFSLAAGEDRDKTSARFVPRLGYP